MNRRRILLIAIPSVLVLLCICFAVAAVLGNRDSKTHATQTAAATQLDAPLKALCTGQSGGVPEAASYTAGPGTHKMVAFRTLNATNYNRDSRVGTDTWAAASVGETQLVLCQEDTSAIIEACPYKSQTTGNTSTLNRVQYQVKVRLFAAKTGQPVANTTLLGSKPRECQDQETFPSGASSISVAGDQVAVSDIQGWLRTYVAP